VSERPPEPPPQLIEVKKYPNRRLYDSTRSRHLTHEELYDLVVAGHTVRVTESRTGADITALVLVQAVVERNPEKFAALPPELVHFLVRASDPMLRGFVATWLAQMMSAMAGGKVPGWGAGSAVGVPPMPPWPASVADMGLGWPRGPMSGPAAGGNRSDPVGDLESRLAAMAEELRRIKAGRSG
jgi:polyhydroxyalkanoate synthesis repressor PhaR